MIFVNMDYEKNLQQTKESKESPFDWRDYLFQPENMPVDSAAKLNELSRLVNEGGPEAEEFLKTLRGGHYRKALLSLVQVFRDLLTLEERDQLFDAIEKCGPSDTSLRRFAPHS
jgi:hypothetical protein